MGEPNRPDRKVDVYEYLDYREFLRDCYAYLKRTRRGFSHRAFSRRAGLGSPNHLKRVMDGERNLTSEMAQRFASALGLDGDAAEYFVQLVALGQAKTTAARSEAYAKLSRFSAYRRTRKLDLAHAAYHSTWYVPVVRELAGRADFRPDPRWIAQQVLPAIKPSEASAALQTLLQIGLLREEDDGSIRQSEPLITTGPEMHALHIANYHRMMMERAAAAIDLVPPERRDISAVVLLLSESGIAKLKSKVQRFRRELLELSLAETGADQVVQMNLQMFPLTAKHKQGKGQ